MEPPERINEPSETPPAQDPDDQPAAARLDHDAPQRRGNRHHMSRRRGRSKRSGAPRDGGDAARGDPAPLQAESVPGERGADVPGAPPLGTDDEAAGTPPGAAAVDAEIDRAAQGAGRQGLTAEEAMKGRPGHPEESPRGFGRFVTIGAAVVIALILLFLLF